MAYDFVHRAGRTALSQRLGGMKCGPEIVRRGHNSGRPNAPPPLCVIREAMLRVHTIGYSGELLGRVQQLDALQPAHIPALYNIARRDACIYKRLTAYRQYSRASSNFVSGGETLHVIKHAGVRCLSSSPRDP